MIPLAELKRQNDEIVELCKVLSVLLEDDAICNSNICRELWERFNAKVQSHLSLQDKTLYADLLSHRNKQVNRTAIRFLNGSKEIKRLYYGYLKQWLREGARAHEREAFIRDTREIMRLLLDRIRNEEKEMFPFISNALSQQTNPAAHAG